MDLFLLFAISFIVCTCRYYQKLKYKLPPGPFSWPILGNLPNIEPDISKCLDDWSQTYGKIISVWVGSTLNVVVSNSELAQEVLKDKDLAFAHRPRNKPVSIMSKNGKGILWSDYNPQFAKLRKICTFELFSQKGIEDLRGIREGEVRAMVDSIYKNCVSLDNKTGKNFLLRKYLNPLVLNIVSMSVLGSRFFTREGEANELGLEFKAILDNELKLATSLSPAEHIWWLNWIFGLRNKAFSRHLIRRDGLIQTIIEEHKKDCDAKKHLVNALLSLQKSFYGVTGDSITGLLWDVTTAGMETSSVVVEYAMAQLVKNPMLQRKAQEELDHVIGNNRVMYESDISNLPYLRCIVKETLRLHPPAPFLLPHKANSNVQIGGYDIPIGTNIHVNVRAIGRDPEIWEDPLEFRPERFLDEDVEMKGYDFRLLPFGAGRRMCPAAQLGINLVTSMIGHLLHHFHWMLPDGVVPEEIDLSGVSGSPSFLKTPLQVVPILRLPARI